MSELHLLTAGFWFGVAIGLAFTVAGVLGVAAAVLWRAWRS